jgi:hypothetical protein
MSTQINVTVDSGGLADEDKQQRQSMRWAKLEKDGKSLVYRTGLDERGKALNQQAKDPSGKPKPSTPAPVLRRDEPAAFRSGCFIELIPTEALATSTGSLPDDFPFRGYTFNWSVLSETPTTAAKWYASRLKGLRPRAEFGEGFNVLIPQELGVFPYSAIREQFNPAFLSYESAKLRTNNSRLTELIPLANENSVYSISTEGLLYAGSFQKPFSRLKKLTIEAVLDVDSFTDATTGSTTFPGNACGCDIGVYAPATSPTVARPSNSGRSLTLQVKSFQGTREAVLSFATSDVAITDLTIPQTLVIKAELDRTGKTALTVNGAKTDNGTPSAEYAASASDYFDKLVKLNIFYGIRSGIRRPNIFSAWPPLPPDIRLSGFKCIFE